MTIKVSIEMPDMECIYCYSLDTEIITFVTTKENLVEVFYGCKECQRSWTDIYSIVYTITRTDEVIEDERDYNKD